MQQRDWRYYEDLELGDEIGPMEKHITDEDVTAFCRLWGAPRPNRFTDEGSATKVNLSWPIVPGIMSLAIMSQLFTRWDGVVLKHLDVVFRQPVPHDLVSVTAVITDKREEDGEYLAECDVYLSTEENGRLVGGKAVFSLPAQSQTVAIAEETEAEDDAEEEEEEAAAEELELEDAEVAEEVVAEMSATDTTVDEAPAKDAEVDEAAAEGLEAEDTEVAEEVVAEVSATDTTVDEAPAKDAEVDEAAAEGLEAEDTEVAEDVVAEVSAADPSVDEAPAAEEAQPDEAESKDGAPEEPEAEEPSAERSEAEDTGAAEVGIGNSGTDGESGQDEDIVAPVEEEEK